MLTNSIAEIQPASNAWALPGSADDAGAAREAHDLVAVAGNCGAGALSALARDIERACKQGLISDAEQSFARMQGMATGAINAIADLRNAPATL